MAREGWRGRMDDVEVGRGMAREDQGWQVRVRQCK